MVLSRGLALSLLIALLVCSRLVRTTNSECGGHQPDDSQRCREDEHMEDDGFDADDDIDDTYKIVNKMVIPPPLSTLAGPQPVPANPEAEGGHDPEPDVDVIETETIVLGH